MYKEELEYAKSHCLFHSDCPVQKENAELKEKISVLLSCKNCPENKGGYICEKEYNNKCLAQKIQYIKELKQENSELKRDNEGYEKDNSRLVQQYNDLQKENAELKEELDAIDKAGKHVRQQINDAFRNKKPYWELEKENAELKMFRQDCVKLTEDNVVMARQRAETSKQLTKAKELLNEFMRISKASDEDFEHDYSELIGEAEQFLKENK